MLISRHSVQLVYVVLVVVGNHYMGLCYHQICSVAVDFDKDFVPLATRGTNQDVIRLHIVCMSCNY